jgi:uncharacterized protein
MFDLDEPRATALITGASSGLGAAFARTLARRGYDLVLVARREERLQALADELQDGREIRIEVLPADLSTHEGLTRVTDRIDAGGVTLVVNNAGVGASGQFAEIPIERQMSMIDLNVRALTAVAHAALNTMRKKERGAIINVACTVAFQPGPYMATYAATKAYVLSFTESLHEEARQHGVTVTCLSPGPMHTEFLDVAGFDMEEWPSFVFEPVERVVAEALDAVRSRRALVVPGVAPKAAMVGSRLVPRFVPRRIAAMLFQPDEEKTA